MTRAAFDDLPVPDISLHSHGNTHFAFRITCLIYLVSFSLPAVGGMPGCAIFIYGGLYTVMIFGLPFTFPWLANPILWVGLVYLRRTGDFAAARMCGVFASLFAAAFFFMSKESLGIGYWTWLASMVSLVLASSPVTDQPNSLVGNDDLEDDSANGLVVRQSETRFVEEPTSSARQRTADVPQ